MKLLKIILALCLIFLFTGISFSVNGFEDIPQFKDIPQDVIESVKDAVKGFQKPMPPETFKSITERSNEIVNQKLQDKSTKPEPVKVAGKGAGKVFYFFSFSMPETAIKESILDAVRINKEHERVTMLLRGFVDNNLKSTIKAFYKLIKEAGINSDLPLEINPELFDKYSVSEVPTIIEVSDGKTGLIKGIRLPYAISRLDEELKDYGKYGSTYPVKEENILKVMEAKQGIIEKVLKERLAKIKSEMYVLKKYDGRFERVKKDRVYRIDPTVTLARDIVDHEGKVLFAKGSKFNPSDYVSLGRYVVIDGNDPKQVDFALKGDFKKVILIRGDLVKLTGRYKKRFYFANDLLIERLKIKRVPLIIEQEGEYIRVTEKAINNS